MGAGGTATTTATAVRTAGGSPSSDGAVGITADASGDGNARERRSRAALGEPKLLMHKKTGKIRFMLRREGSRKIVGNFYVEAAV